MRRKLIWLQTTTSDGGLQRIVKAAGWEIHAETSPGEASALIEKEYPNVGLVFLDNLLINGIKYELETLFCNTNQMEWVGLVSPSLLTNPDVSQLIVKYCYDYHTLPADSTRLLTSLGHACGMSRIRQSFTKPPLKEVNGYQMIGSSSLMRSVFQQIDKIANADSPVMVSGESGTGKELVARAIHRESQRANGPFIAVNCGAIPATLIQSELFGHEKGAFTGAYKHRIGHIESANDGTIFLDEIGDLSLELQVNLLRFLQERTIKRVGSIELIPVDVRVITATHKNLKEAVRKGEFREDLYYRLHVLSVELPRLSERREDIEPLAHYFFHEFISVHNKKINGFSTRALQQMYAYDWPGNVRELKNTIERAVVMCDHRLIEPEDMGLIPTDKPTDSLTLSMARAKADQQALVTALHFSSNNISEAARKLGISRVTFYRMLDKYKLAPVPR